jgi:hypothetical protein
LCSETTVSLVPDGRQALTGALRVLVLAIPQVLRHR